MTDSTRTKGQKMATTASVSFVVLRWIELVVKQIPNGCAGAKSKMQNITMKIVRRLQSGKKSGELSNASKYDIENTAYFGSAKTETRCALTQQWKGQLKMGQLSSQILANSATLMEDWKRIIMITEKSWTSYGYAHDVMQN